jgi:hypothetical protein
LSTVTGIYVAPAGTVTVIDVLLAAETIAFVAPKYTMFDAAVVLNPVPVIVTEDPGYPAEMLNAEMVGAPFTVITVVAAQLGPTE